MADAVHGRLVRVAEGGTILEELRPPGMGVFACMLGGEDGRTLFICAAPTFEESVVEGERRAAILMTRVKAPRAGRP